MSALDAAFTETGDLTNYKMPRGNSDVFGLCCVQNSKALIIIISRTGICSIQMLTDGRI